MAEEDKSTVSLCNEAQPDFVENEKHKRTYGNAVKFGYTLLDHTKLNDEGNKHSSNKLYCCNKCWNLYDTSEEFMSQHTIICSGENQAYECRQCGFEAGSEIEATEHYLPDNRCDATPNKKVGERKREGAKLDHERAESEDGKMNEGTETTLSEKTMEEEGRMALVSEKGEVKEESRAGTSENLTSDLTSDTTVAGMKLDYSKVIKKRCVQCNILVEGTVRTANGEACPKICGNVLVHTCAKCNEGFAKYANAKHHVTSICYHSQYKCEIPHCSFKTTVRSCYLRHKRTMHDKN